MQCMPSRGDCFPEQGYATVVCQWEKGQEQQHEKSENLKCLW